MFGLFTTIRHFFNPPPQAQLIQAAAVGDTETVAQLINNGHDGLHPDTVYGKQTALAAALASYQKDTVDFLLNRGASTQNGNGWTALHQVTTRCPDEIWTNETECKWQVQRLLAAGANPLAHPKNGEPNSTPLDYALIEGFPSYPSWSLTNDANLISQIRQAKRGLASELAFCAVYSEKKPKAQIALANKLLNKYKFTDTCAFKRVMQSVRQNNFETLQALQHDALQRNDYYRILYLHENGAPLTQQQANQEFFNAMHEGLFPVAQNFLDQCGAQVNTQRRSDKRTMLHLAVAASDAAAVAFLLENSADITMIDDHGNNAISMVQKPHYRSEQIKASILHTYANTTSSGAPTFTDFLIRAPAKLEAPKINKRKKVQQTLTQARVKNHS